MQITRQLATTPTINGFFGSFGLENTVAAQGVVQWVLRRGEDVVHVIDLLPVVPADVNADHHVTSTLPGAGPFQAMLIVSRSTDTGHVTITNRARTIRRPKQETVHRELTHVQVVDALADLGLHWDTATVRALCERRLRELD